MEINPFFPPLDSLHEYFDPEKTTSKDVRHCLSQKSYKEKIAKQGKDIEEVVEEIMQKLQAIASRNNEEQ